ncbi:MAG: hypothetical protein RL257_461, partial [Actinomycetota bacterium]
MKMIFIFKGRPGLSVSRAKIQLCAQAKSPQSDGTATGAHRRQPAGWRPPWPKI